LQLVDIIVGERTLLVALGVVKEGEGDEGERTHLQFVDISRYDAGWWLVALGAVLRWRCCGEGEGRCEKQKCRGSIMFSMILLREYRGIAVRIKKLHPCGHESGKEGYSP
jgi:hypothetical protein